MAKIKLVEICSDLGGRTAGASLGIDAIRIASYGSRGDYSFYERFEEEMYDRIVAPNNSFHSETQYPFARRIEKIIPIYEETCKSVTDGLYQADFTIVISGDHSSAGGTIAGIKNAYPNKRLGVVWIDAHADVHNPYTSDSGNMHGMPLATAINDNNLECRFNEISSETSAMWEKLKHIGGRKDKLDMADVVYVALRDYEHAERSIIAKHNSKIIRTIDVRQLGAKDVALQISRHLEHCDIIYVSFDVDSLDPSVSIGTGTPFEGGLYAYEAKELLRTLAALDKVKLIEITEINPTLDIENKMAKTAFDILKSICRVIDLRF
ncbi:MAG: arginase [Ignavibacteria bacterium]|jgi:arginase|nr:arginase [Ignavibacteria bacterium]